MPSSSIRLICLLPLAVLSASAASQQAAPDIASPGLVASVDSRLTPKTVRALSPEVRGDIFMARKMYRDAVDLYRGLPETAALDNKIGIAFHQLLEFKLAKAWYGRAIALDPHYGDAINNLGTVYYSEKSFGKAISYYKRALKDDGPKATVYANLGAAYFAKRKFKDASKYYEQALAIDPQILLHRNGFGTVMQEQTVTDLAVFHLYLAKACAKAGKTDDALLYLRKALEEGLKDRRKLPDVPEFALLKDDPNFKLLLAQDPKPL